MNVPGQSDACWISGDSVRLFPYNRLGLVDQCQTEKFYIMLASSSVHIKQTNTEYISGCAIRFFETHCFILVIFLYSNCSQQDTPLCPFSANAGLRDCRKIKTEKSRANYTLSGSTGSELAWHTRGRVCEARLLQQVLRFVAPIYTVQMWSSGGTAHEGGDATSQLDLQSLTTLSAAACDRLQLGVPHWATSVDYCK